MNRYPGGKNAEGTWRWLVGHMTPHAYYGELFVGSGAVLKHKVPALRSYVFDLDPDVVDYWRRLAFPGVVSSCECSIEWLAKHGPTLGPDWLLYLDPPYLPETRVKKKLYKFELTPAQHRQLLAAARSATCRVMISGYASAMYDDALRGWSRYTLRVSTRGHRRGKPSMRTEVLWCNYSSDVARDYAHPTPGRNWRERDRIKKRLRRIAAKFRTWPEYERRAVLAELVRQEQAIDDGCALVGNVEGGRPRQKRR